MRSTFIFFLMLIISILSGCVSTTPPMIFVPQQDPQVLSFYRNGLPIGAISTDSSFIMISMEPTDLSRTRYMRLWFLYENNSSQPYLLEPLKTVNLSILGEKKTYEEITPESPTKILADIENEKAVNLILQSIGGTLQAMATKPTSITNSSGEEWKVNDRPEKIQGVTNKTLVNMSNTALLYDIFRNSVNAGILRRNTIFPTESVNGYMYLPLPEVDKYNGIFFDPSVYTYKLLILTQHGEKTVIFTPTLGE